MTDSGPYNSALPMAPQRKFLLSSRSHASDMKRVLVALPIPPTEFFPTRKEKSKTGCTWLDGQSADPRERFRRTGAKPSFWLRKSRKKCWLVHDQGEPEFGNCSNTGKSAGWTMPLGGASMRQNWPAQAASAAGQNSLAWPRCWMRPRHASSGLRKLVTVRDEYQHVSIRENQLAELSFQSGMGQNHQLHDGTAIFGNVRCADLVPRKP